MVINGNHWIVASTCLASEGEVNLYDSIYSDVGEATKAISLNHP